MSHISVERGAAANDPDFGAPSPPAPPMPAGRPKKELPSKPHLLQYGLLEDGLALPRLNHLLNLLLIRVLPRHCVHPPLHNFPVLGVHARPAGCFRKQTNIISKHTHPRGGQAGCRKTNALEAPLEPSFWRTLPPPYALDIIAFGAPPPATCLNGRHDSNHSNWSAHRRSWNSPIKSFSFFLSAPVMAVRVRSLLLPGPHPLRLSDCGRAGGGC